MILRFAVANKGLTGTCLAFVFVTAIVAQIPSMDLAHKLGVDRTFADALVSGVGSGNSISAAWCLVPLVSQSYLSYLFSQNYRENFAIRWCHVRLIRVGKILDALIVSIAASLILIASLALISCFQGCPLSNFSDAHSLFSYCVQKQAAREPDALSFVLTMGAYAFFAVSTVNQFYLLLNKFIHKDAVVVSILFLVGCFQLYSGRSIELMFGNASIAMLGWWNPLGVLYALGDVGYASWLAASSHKLAVMLAVLAALVVLNGLIPERSRRS